MISVEQLDALHTFPELVTSEVAISLIDEVVAARARIAELERIIFEATPGHMFGRDDTPDVMAYTAQLQANDGNRRDYFSGWHQMVMLGDHQRVVDQLRAQGLSQEDREALEAGARELSITAVDYEHHRHKLLLAKEQDSLAIKARAHAAILRRLGGQTT